MQTKNNLKCGTWIYFKERIEQNYWGNPHKVSVTEEYHTGKIVAYSKSGVYVVRVDSYQMHIEPQEIIAWGPAAELLYG